MLQIDSRMPYSLELQKVQTFLLRFVAIEQLCKLMQIFAVYTKLAVCRYVCVFFRAVFQAECQRVSISQTGWLWQPQSFGSTESRASSITPSAYVAYKSELGGQLSIRLCNLVCRNEERENNEIANLSKGWPSHALPARLSSAQKFICPCKSFALQRKKRITEIKQKLSVCRKISFQHEMQVAQKYCALDFFEREKILMLVNLNNHTAPPKIFQKGFWKNLRKYKREVTN